MAYTVLARRYRSATFDEVVGQEHVAQTLKKAIESGRIAHAYLFCGTRGTGKTSMARILAKALNCEKAKGPTTEPCLKCESCIAIARGDDIDVVEIDAASNTGVDNVRDLIENSRYRPARSRFKVYIIDEVHMLSKSAFNALLKTLEEPPEHVKFILATTEPEKVLPTILSRCQRYDFRNIPTREIAEHLKEICQQEKIKADEDALLLVAKAGAGSMRDSLSLLDRLLSVGEKQLTVEMIEQLLGMPKAMVVFDLAQGIGEGKTKAVLETAAKLITEGLSPDALVASLVEHFRNLLVLRTCGGDSGLVEVPGIPMKDLEAQAANFDPVVLTQDITILEELRRQIRTSQVGRAMLDATLVRLALAEQFASVGELLARVDGRGAAAAQKKKPEGDGLEEGSGAGGQGSREDTAPVPAGAAAQAAAAVADEEDVLPQVGRVWEGQARSLSAIFKSQSKPPAPPTAPVASANVEPNVVSVEEGDEQGVWRAALTLIAARGPALHAMLAAGRYGGVEEGLAVVRYEARHDTFVKMLERNGKKEVIRDVFSKVLGREVGVRFEVDPAGAAPAEKAGVAPPPAKPQVAAAAAAAPAAPVRLTSEQLEELRKDPLIRAIEELGATIVKVE